MLISGVTCPIKGLLINTTSNHSQPGETVPLKLKFINNEEVTSSFLWRCMRWGLEFDLVLDPMIFFISCYESSEIHKHLIYSERKQK